jgi:hypothetical protein
MTIGDWLVAGLFFSTPVAILGFWLKVVAWDAWRFRGTHVRKRS